MGSEHGVWVRIAVTSEDAALDLVRRKLKDAAREMEDAGRSAKTMEGAIGGLRTALGALGAAIGVGAIVAFFRSAAQAAIENEQANKRLVDAARDLTGATEEGLEALLPWMDALEQASGLTNEQLTPGVIQLMSATKDLSQAQAFAEIATGAAARGMGTFEGNVSSLTRLLQTGTVRGVDAFSNALREAAKDGKLTSDEMATLHARFGDAGSAVDTTAQRVARSKIAWDNMKEAIGNAMTGVLVPLIPLLKGVMYALSAVVAGALQMGGAIKAGAELGWGALQGLWTLIQTRDARLAQNVVDQWADVADKTMSEYSSRAEGLLDEVAAALERGTAEVSKGSKEVGKAFAGGIDLGAQEAARKAVEAMQKIRDAFASAAMRSSDEALKESSAVIENYLKGLQEARLEDMKSASDRVSSEGRTWQALRKVQAQGLRGLRADELRSRRDTLMQILLMQKTNAAQRKEILAELAATEIEIEKEKAAAQTQVNMEVAANFLGAASALFGNNKALAIASTVIQTWAGAQAAFAETPGPVWVKAAAAAAAVLAGMARVKSIQETDFKKGGFDIPANDAAAYDVGQRWGEKWGGDMLSFLDQGITAGFAGRLAGLAFRGPAQAYAPTFNSYHTQNSRGATIHQNINVIGGFAGEAQLRALEKMRRRASRAYDRSIVSRRVTRIGSMRTT